MSQFQLTVRQEIIHQVLVDAETLEEAQNRAAFGLGAWITPNPSEFEIVAVKRQEARGG